MKKTFQERLKEIMRIRGYKQVDIVEKAKKYAEETGVKISKTDLSQYVNGKVEARQDKLFVLAKVLNVSEAWLMGFDVPMNEKGENNLIKESKEDFIVETIAAHIDDDVTEEEMQEILDFIEFKKRNRK